MSLDVLLARTNNITLVQNTKLLALPIEYKSLEDIPATIHVKITDNNAVNSGLFRMFLLVRSSCNIKEANGR